LLPAPSHDCVWIALAESESKRRVAVVFIVGLCDKWDVTVMLFAITALQAIIY